MPRHYVHLHNKYAQSVPPFTEQKMPCRYLHLQNKPRTDKLIYAASFRFDIQKSPVKANRRGVF
jgi:hypothetical protein